MTTDPNREVEGERERLIERLRWCRTKITLAAADMLRSDLTELKTLRSANAALRADAERYRWLRNESGDLDKPYIGAASEHDNWLTGVMADAAIDAALANRRTEGEGIVIVLKFQKYGTLMQYNGVPVYINGRLITRRWLCWWWPINWLAFVLAAPTVALRIYRKWPKRKEPSND